MAKSWQCTQCGYKVRTGIRDSLADVRPDRCDNCDNDTFEALRTTGAVHRTIDGSSETLDDEMTRRRALQVMGGGALVASGSWWFLGRPTVESTTGVSMHDAQFHPRNIEVDVGATVTWANDATSGEGDEISFILMSAISGWDFETEVPEDESASYTFEEPGEYALYAQGLGSPDLSGMSMKIGVGEPIDEPLGGWF